MRGAVSHPFLLQFCSLLQGRSCLWTVSISTQINCLQKFYGKRAFRACGEKAKRRADVNRFFVAGAERNVLSCSKRQVHAVFFRCTASGGAEFCKNMFCVYGRFVGASFVQANEKRQKGKKLFFAKIASVTKTLLRQGVFGTEKRFFQKILPPFLSTVARKGGVWYNVFR